jgi:hypothetical protein
MSEGYRMPSRVVFSLQVLTLELDGGGFELAAQSGGKVHVATAKTWEEAYWELRRKVRAG